MDKKLYKIISVTDKEGNIKQDAIDQMKEICADMVGEVVFPELIKAGTRFCLLWNNDSGRMMRTSLIESFDESNLELEVVTRNSVYTLRDVSDEKVME